MRRENTFEKKIELDAGLKIEDKLYKTIIIREVVGFDEEAISQPQFRNNPAAMLHSLISRCIAEVPGAPRHPSMREIKLLPVGVLDSIILDIRELTLGEDFIDFKPICTNPDCKKPNEITVYLADIRGGKKSYSIKTVALSKGVKKGDKVLKKARIRPINGEIQETFSKKKEADYFKFGEMGTELIAACLLDIDGEKIENEDIQAMSRRDRKLLSDAIQDMEGPALKRSVVCEYCGHEFEDTVNALDFLA